MNFSRASLISVLMVTLLSGIMITIFFVSVTKEPISQIKIKKHRELIQKLMPLAYNNDLVNDKIEITALGDLGTSNPVPIYRARSYIEKADRPVGLIILPMAPGGYNGMIKLAVSIDSQGKILIANILEHNETPAFGDAIHQDNSDWLESFIGKTSTELAEEAGIDQISGASVSSNAVTTAIIKSLAFYQREKDQLWE